MKLAATYRSKDGTRFIGRDIEYFEAHQNLFFRLLGVRGHRRKRIEMVQISEETAIDILRQALRDDGFFILEISDGNSSVDFAADTEESTFFVEQYFDLIYGGIYSIHIAEQIVKKIFSGCSSDELRDFFPTLDGELVYEYREKKTG